LSGKTGGDGRGFNCFNRLLNGLMLGYKWRRFPLVKGKVQRGRVLKNQKV